MKILGIDPGIEGGLFLVEDGKPKTWTVMPVVCFQAGFAKKGGKLKHDGDGNKIPKHKTEVDPRRLAQILAEYRPDQVVLERVHAFAGQGVTSMFSFGTSFGMLRGSIGWLDMDPLLVEPQAWQKAMFDGMTTGSTKCLAAKVIAREWPQVDLRKSKRARKPHDGLCDAACLALYGWKLRQQ